MVNNRVRELVADGALSDEQLVERVRSGDTALFEVLMRRNNQRVYRAVRAIIRDEAETEEIMQQAYVSAFAHLAQFRGQARFSTWLLKIAIHEAFARKRRDRRLIALEGSSELTSIARTQPDPEHDASTRELARSIEGAVEGLPDAYRSVFMLREVEGLSTADAALVLDVSEEVIKTRLHRAKAMVRDKLQAQIGAATSAAFPFRDPRCDRVVAAVMSRIAS